MVKGTDKPTGEYKKKSIGYRPLSKKARLTLMICVFAGLCIASGVVYIDQRWDSIKDAYFIETVEVEKEVIKWVEHLRMPTHLMIEHLKPSLDPDVAKKIGLSVEKYSKEYQLPKKLILSIMYHESSYDLFAKSKAGAIGLMQVLPKFHQDKIDDMGITDQRKLYHIDNNINLGCKIWKTYYDASDKDIDETFHSYLSKNASEEVKNKYKTKILETWARLEFLEFQYENGHSDRKMTDERKEMTDEEKRIHAH
jgi:hypothetical protein